MTDTMPYTHWAYFPDQASADACAAELTERLDCLVGVDAPEPDEREWLLRAARTVVVDELVEAHSGVREIVVRHGGEYDGGESGAFDPRTGKFL